jgi:hypothetical protein
MGKKLSTLGNGRHCALPITTKNATLLDEFHILNRFKLYNIYPYGEFYLVIREFL